jgi:hypothetical protein
MQEDVKKFFKYLILVGGIAVFLSLSIFIYNIKDLLFLFGIPTLIFVPIAYITVKFPSIMNYRYNSMYVQVIGLLLMVLGMIIVPKLPLYLKVSSSVLAFEMTCFCYWVLSHKNNNSDSKKCS